MNDHYGYPEEPMNNEPFMEMTEWELRPVKSYQGNGLLEQMVSGGY